jgi:hypothetical protein
MHPPEGPAGDSQRTQILNIKIQDLQEESVRRPQELGKILQVPLIQRGGVCAVEMIRLATFDGQDLTYTFPRRTLMKTLMDPLGGSCTIFSDCCATVPDGRVLWTHNAAASDLQHPPTPLSLLSQTCQ